MPEGDTLFRIARTLKALEGKVVLDVDLPRGPRADGLKGQTVTRAEAQGKNLLVHFSGGVVLHVHLKMNGRVRLYSAPQRWTRPAFAPSLVVYLEVAGHQVVIVGAPVVRLIRAREVSVDPRLGGLGPDVLAEDFDPQAAAERLRRQGAVPLGEALLDQSVIAGVGNVFKSEVLFNLKLDPFRAAGTYELAQLAALMRHTARVMRVSARGVTGQRVTRADRRAPQSVYGRSGRPCFDCGTRIRMRRQGQLHRSTYFCPACQAVAEEA